MLRSLSAESAPRIRLLAKFVEKDYEKIERLTKLRREYASKVSIVDREISQEKAEISPVEQGNREDGWLSRRLDAGLFSLQAGRDLPNRFRANYSLSYRWLMSSLLGWSLRMVVLRGKSEAC